MLLAVGITTFTLRYEYDENLKTRMYELMPLYSTESGGNASTIEATKAWNAMQLEVTLK